MSLIPAMGKESSTEPICSVIIPVFNGLTYTHDCIEALLADRSAASFEIIVVDAGSTDGVEQYLSKLQNRVTLLSTEENFGLAYSMNKGAQSARGKYLVFLGSDTLPVPGWLDNLVAAVESNADIGVVGSRLLYPLHRLVQHAGIIFNDQKEPVYIYQGFQDDHPAVNKRRDFDAVSYACMLIRREIFFNLAGMNENFRNGFEDYDFCLRVRQSGGRVVYEPRSVLFHYGDITPDRDNVHSPNGRLFKELWQDKIEPDNLLAFLEDGYDPIPSGKGWRLKPTGVDVKFMMDQARENLKDGRLQEAVDQYESIYYLLPHATTIMRYLARIYKLRGDFENVTTMLLRISSLEPDADVLINLADITLKKKQYELARRFAKGVLEAIGGKNTKTAAAHAIIGDSWFKSGNIDIAEQEYNQALSDFSQDVRAYTGLGTVALTREQYTGALSHFEKALTYSPHHGRAILGKGLAYLGLGRLELATEQISEGVNLDPENGWALQTLLPLLSQFGRLDQADTMLGKYLDLYPDDVPLLLARAGIAFARDQFTECRKYIELALALEPNNQNAIELDAELSKINVSKPKSVEYAMA